MREILTQLVNKKITFYMHLLKVVEVGVCVVQYVKSVLHRCDEIDAGHSEYFRD